MNVDLYTNVTFSRQENTRYVLRQSMIAKGWFEKKKYMKNKE